MCNSGSCNVAVMAVAAVAAAGQGQARQCFDTSIRVLDTYAPDLVRCDRCPRLPSGQSFGARPLGEQQACDITVIIRWRV